MTDGSSSSPAPPPTVTHQFASPPRQREPPILASWQELLAEVTKVVTRMGQLSRRNVRRWPASKGSPLGRGALTGHPDHGQWQSWQLQPLEQPHLSLGILRSMRHRPSCSSGRRKRVGRELMAVGSCLQKLCAPVKRLGRHALSPVWCSSGRNQAAF